MTLSPLDGPKWQTADVIENAVSIYFATMLLHRTISNVNVEKADCDVT